MRRVLFDENLPRQLRRDLGGFSIRTVQEEGWGSLQNGQLLRRAAESFEVFVTADRRMQYQQSLPSFAIGIVLIVTPRLQLGTLRTVLEPLRQAMAIVKPGEKVTVTVPRS